MPMENEVYDMFLANAGKCPKCGEFLTIKKNRKFSDYKPGAIDYYVKKECLACDYEEDISYAFNDAMGNDSYRIKKQENVKAVKDAIDSVPYYTASQKEPVRNLPYSYFKVNDVLEREIKCPKCGSVNSFDITYNCEIRDLVHKCNECDTEFVLRDIDYSTGIGVATIVKTSPTRKVCK